MDAEYSEALTVMEQAFRRLESRVPPPKNQSLGGRLVLRYEEKNIEQAIVQKLAKKRISSPSSSRIRCNAWNYYYRALLDVTTAAKALGDEHLVAQMYEYIPLFQSKTGIDGGFGRSIEK